MACVPYASVLRYAESIGQLRQRAADKQRDAYTVSLGALMRLGLIERSEYDRIMSWPRIKRDG